MLTEILFFFLAIIIGCRYCAKRLYLHGKCSTMLILGSGGHTAELLSYARLLPQSYTPRIYVVASTDSLSGKKVVELEKRSQRNDYSIEQIPRSREVGQYYFTSFFTTSYALIFAVSLVLKHQPQLVLCNGPGTCVPVCFVARLLHLICNIGPYVGGDEMRRRTAVVFVESVCRTRSLSLSGRLIYHLRLAKVIVQWPGLLEKYPRAQYIGLLS